MASWNSAKREQVSNQYRDALKGLIDVYKWSMGKDTEHHWEKLAVKTLRVKSRHWAPGFKQDYSYMVKYGFKTDAYRFIRDNDILEEFEMMPLIFGKPQTVFQAYHLYGEHGVDKLFEVVQTNIKSQVNDFVAKTERHHQNNCRY